MVRRNQSVDDLGPRGAPTADHAEDQGLGLGGPVAPNGGVDHRGEGVGAELEIGPPEEEIDEPVGGFGVRVGACGEKGDDGGGIGALAIE